jgi:hypothetical protein
MHPASISMHVAVPHCNHAALHLEPNLVSSLIPYSSYIFLLFRLPRPKTALQVIL